MPDLNTALDPDVARPVAKVAFAVATVLAGNATETFNRLHALQQCLVPGSEVVRYRRIWRAAKYEVVDDRYLLGRIGYEEPGTVEELWNPETQDFEGTQLTLGTTSPFVFDTRAMRIAYQLRPGRIRPTTFTGNLQALLNKEGGRTWRWRISADVDGIAWDDWVESVDRITELRIQVREPNPNWGGRDQLKRTVTGANAYLVKLVYRAKKDATQGVDLSDGMISEAIEHADEGYGSYSAVGEREEDGETVKAKWRPDIEGEPKQAVVEADPGTTEVSHDGLKRALEEEEPEDDES